jgi:HPt (histidine-containing phosphotransfer) domain-containing protein
MKGEAGGEVDRSVLDRRAQTMGYDGLAEVLSAYFRDLERMLSGLRDGAAQRDLRAMRLHAHSLRGTCATLGADRLAELCAEFELDLQERAGAGAGARLPEIERRLQQATVEWRALCTEYAARGARLKEP